MCTSASESWSLRNAHGGRAHQQYCNRDAPAIFTASSLLPPHTPSLDPPHPNMAYPPTWLQMYLQPAAAAADPALQQKVDELQAENTKLQSDVADLQSKLAQALLSLPPLYGGAPH